MRLLFAALAAVVLVAAAPVRQAPRPASTAAVTPQGGFRLGRADAPVQIVEYASLTCPHCRAFHSEGWATLKRDYIAKGLVAIEVRNMVLNGPDVVATLLARCDGASTFFARVDSFYDQQAVWTAPFGHVTAAQQAQLAKLPQSQQLAGLGRAGHLDAFAARLGIPPAHYAACVTNTAGTERLDALEKLAGAQGVKGTPTFFLNGALVNGNSWEAVQTAIRTALKK